MTIVVRLACLALAALLPAVALAQPRRPFRLVAAGNITGCIAADPQFARVHIFTLKDGEPSSPHPAASTPR